MCPPKGRVFAPWRLKMGQYTLQPRPQGRFFLAFEPPKSGKSAPGDFAHFGLESGMVLKGTTVVYERIYCFNSK